MQRNMMQDLYWLRSDTVLDAEIAISYFLYFIPKQNIFKLPDIKQITEKFFETNITDSL